jgi:hypothetical protein
MSRITCNFLVALRQKGYFLTLHYKLLQFLVLVKSQRGLFRIL